MEKTVVGRLGRLVGRLVWASIRRGSLRESQPLLVGGEMKTALSVLSRVSVYPSVSTGSPLPAGTSPQIIPPFVESGEEVKSEGRGTRVEGGRMDVQQEG
jgi:hypothetical protein